MKITKRHGTYSIEELSVEELEQICKSLGSFGELLNHAINGVMTFGCEVSESMKHSDAPKRLEKVRDEIKRQVCELESN